MNYGFDPLNLILLAAAIIIFWRLRSVLGQRTGYERPAPDLVRPKPAEAADQSGESAQLGVKEDRHPPPVWKGHAPEGSQTAKALEAIAAKSSNFTVTDFLRGASLAYEMVLEAFARGDKQALKPLLSRDVMQGFSEAIDERVRARRDMTLQFVGIKKAELALAELEGNRALLAVRFVAEVIGATKDQAGKVIDGDEREVRELRDQWVFERDITARDPNWKLVSTGDNAA
jgi:predicted lipid-binding transport protein (Tim44 family)